MEQRRLQWQRSIVVGGVTPDSFTGLFDREDVGTITMVPAGFPMHGTWDYRLTYHGMFCAALPSFGIKKSGNLPTRQEAADEVTRLWWLIYDEMQDAGMNWRDYIARGAVWNRA